MGEIRGRFGGFITKIISGTRSKKLHKPESTITDGRYSTDI